MEFFPDQKTIRSLLKSGAQFNIPRFQREYSWEKKHYEEFFEDMMGNLVIKDDTIQDEKYFLGTMLFVGNFSDKLDKPMEIIDGQQRLTTITILFSVISERFRELKNETLSKQLFNYICTEDDDGQEIRVLNSNSSYPYFVYYIQDRNKSIECEPTTEEEKCIKETYEYLYERTSYESLKKILKKSYSPEVIDGIAHIDMLKALRDQVLNCTLISIAATDRDQANKIFEILNSKGKHLSYIDLIKNRIFDKLKNGTDGVFAEESWKEIKDILNNGDEMVGFATFFRHYWISKYANCRQNSLYESFITKIDKNNEAYIEFLIDLKNNAQNYMKIVNPKLSDYGNRKEYLWLVQALNAINKYFNVVQTRIALLALFDVYDQDKISYKNFKKVIQTMENFHFAYTAICSNSSNKLNSLYFKFARKVRKCKNKTEVNDVIQKEYYDKLEKLFPTYENFEKNFIELCYTKKNDSANIKSKYAIYKLNCHFSENEIYPQDGSIEHILPETTGERSLNIGNLILLEGRINNDIGEIPYKDKIEHYCRSQYKWIESFIEKHSSWDEENILPRAKCLAKVFYRDIFKKKIVKKTL